MVLDKAGLPLTPYHKFLEDLQTKQLAVMIVLSLYMGLTSSGVDNAAHVAGLILGILLGILLYRKPKKKMDDGGVWNER